MKFALVTPSYAGDFERCALLVETARRCLPPDLLHHLFVDRRDIELFRPLVSARTRLHEVEALLPNWIRRAPGRTHDWASDLTPPITNWVIQQVVKLSAVDAIGEEMLIFCDSDNAFIRPFDPRARLMQGDKLALFYVEEDRPDLALWRNVAAQLLGLPTRSGAPCNYVGNLIAWRRENIIALRRQLEKTAGASWVRAFVGHPLLSEYVLYGRFVDELLGTQAAGHFHSAYDLVRGSWNNPMATAADIERFFAGLTPSQVAIMVHSKDNVPVAAYRDRVRALLAASGC